MFWDMIGRNAFYDVRDWLHGYAQPDADPAPAAASADPAPAQECADGARPVEAPALPPGDRSAVVRALVASGWSVGQIRALLKGDNGAIGLEVEAVRGPERRVVTISGGRGGEVEV
jgi:hypothetical protein